MRYEDDRRKHLKSAEYNDVHAPKPEVNDKQREKMLKRDAKHYGNAEYSIVQFFIAIGVMIAFLLFPATDEVLPRIWMGAVDGECMRTYGCAPNPNGFLYALVILGGHLRDDGGVHRPLARVR